MNTIERNTDPFKGPPDGVSAVVKCAVTMFDHPAEDGGEEVMSGQTNMDCRILCSFNEGVISFSMLDAGMMLTVRTDELMAIMQVAAGAAREFEASLPYEYTDAVLEARWKELQNIPLDEADSPSGLILATSWWKYPKGTDYNNIVAFFDTLHSKGVEYLRGLSGR